MNPKGRNGSGSQACAACRYQRRRCTSECPLAPFFPAERPTEFANVHKLFGVSNVLKIIKPLSSEQRKEAMKTIKYQADARAKDPVGGCYRMILDLEEQVRRTTEELEQIKNYLSILNNQVHYTPPIHRQDGIPLRDVNIKNNIGNNSTISTYRLGIQYPHLLSLFNRSSQKTERSFSNSMGPTYSSSTSFHERSSPILGGVAGRIEDASDDMTDGRRFHEGRPAWMIHSNDTSGQCSEPMINIEGGSSNHGDGEHNSKFSASLFTGSNQ